MVILGDAKFLRVLKFVIFEVLHDPQKMFLVKFSQQSAIMYST